MNEKLLTICIPTFNRRALLEKHLHNVFSQLRSFSSNDVEVVVSVNPSNDGTEENNVYDEYIVFMDGQTKKVEKIGTTEVDLTNYVQESELKAITNGEIDTIMAG